MTSPKVSVTVQVSIPADSRLVGYLASGVAIVATRSQSGRVVYRQFTEGDWRPIAKSNLPKRLTDKVAKWLYVPGQNQPTSNATEKMPEELADNFKAKTEARKQRQIDRHEHGDCGCKSGSQYSCKAVKNGWSARNKFNTK